MTQRFHPRSVGQLPPGRNAVTGAPCRAEYFDEDERGLSVRVTPRGARAYYYTYSRHGRTRRVRLGDVGTVTLAQAREAARNLRARVQLQRADPAGERAAERRTARAGGPLTVARLVELCLNDIAPRLSAATLRLYRTIIDHHIVPTLGRALAASVTRADVRAVVERIAPRAPVIANRTFLLLKRVWAWGIAQELVTGSPLAGLRKPAVEHASERVLSRGEVSALLAALDTFGTAPLTDVVRLLLLTGVREANVLGMRRAELTLDGAAPRWVIPAGRMKARAQHVVPLAPAALAVIERRLRSVPPGSDLLFPASRGGGALRWSSTFMAQLRAEVDTQAQRLATEGVEVMAPLSKWTIHGLRRTVATHMREELHVSRDVVALILAHRISGGGAATAIYDRAQFLAERRSALVAWAAWLHRLRQPGSARVVPLTRPDPSPDGENGAGAGRAEGIRMGGSSESEGVQDGRAERDVSQGNR